MAPSTSDQKLALAIGVSWGIFVLCFEFPIPSEILGYWLARFAATALATVGVTASAFGYKRWHWIAGAACLLLLVVFLVRTGLLLLATSEIQAREGSRSIVGDLWEQHVALFRQYRTDLDRPLRAWRYLYAELLMPILQSLVFLVLLMKRKFTSNGM